MRRYGTFATLLTLAAIVTLAFTSCVINGGFDRLEDSPLCGEWQSDIEYSGVSDSFYDYGTQVHMYIYMNGDFVMVTENYLKPRTGTEWSQDLSQAPASYRYSAWVYPSSHSKNEGELELLDRMSFENVDTLDYVLSEDGNTLILSKGPYTKRAYTRKTVAKPSV